MSDEWIFECGRCGAMLSVASPQETLPSHERPYPNVPCYNAGRRGIYRGRLVPVAGGSGDEDRLPHSLNGTTRQFRVPGSEFREEAL